VTQTIVETLAEFTTGTELSALPSEVVDESKRVILDSVGCALGGTGQPKGRIGIEYGLLTGGSQGDATIIGTDHRVSIFGAAFANGELTNALDFDAVLPPGHVSPYVIPGALATAESLRQTGPELLAAVAVAHEMSYRLGKSMDYTRDTKDGKSTVAPVVGYAATVFGATAAIARLKGLPQTLVAHSLGIAGAISPVNSHRAWMSHAPSSTVKYTMAGPLTQAAMTAAHMGELGHRGDLQILDDPDYGYRRFIGTQRWEPSNITDGLGEVWRFPAENSYKPYPHCRVLHALLDALVEVVEENDIRPDEIEALNAWGEGWIELPVWLNNTIEHVQDGQFSIAHGLAVGAHRIPPGPAWQDPDLVFGRSVLGLMDKVTFQTHPDWAAAIQAHPASRPSRVEIQARGTTFSAERQFPKGSPSPELSTTMTTDELVAKFLVNADGVLPRTQADQAIDAILNLDSTDDTSTVMRLLGTRQLVSAR
jgi:2-methylcitrate dehydratase PrpD